MLVIGESSRFMLDSAIFIKFSFVLIIVEYKVVLPLFYIDVASWNSWSILLPSIFTCLNSISPLSFLRGVPGFYKLLERRFTPLIADSLLITSVSFLLTIISVPDTYTTAP